MSPFPDAVLHEALSRHTSFGIGGPADYFLVPDSALRLAEIMETCRNEGIPLTLIGDGTNVLVSDAGIRGAVATTKRMNSFEMDEGGGVTALAGARLSQLAEAAWSRSLQGLEFAAGIPGTLGGAVYMNAGAYGGEIGRLVESVLTMPMGADAVWLSRDQMEFGYRYSVLQKSGHAAVMVRLRLSNGIKSDIREKMDDFAKRRRESQPLGERSAGSAFKRPAGGFAARLIDKSGLKGFRVGGAMVSEKHAGFIVNTGGASSDDVIRLMEAVRSTVHRDSGVWLIPEIRLLGE